MVTICTPPYYAGLLAPSNNRLRVIPPGLNPVMESKPSWLPQMSVPV